MLFYFEVADMADAGARFAETDLGRAWATIAPFWERIAASIEAHLREQKAIYKQQGTMSMIGQAFAELWQAEEDFQEETGLTIETALGLLKGGFTIAVVDTAPQGGEPQVVPVLVFPPSARATLQALVAKGKEKQGPSGPPLFLLDREGSVIVTLDQNALVAPALGTPPSSGGRLSDDARYQNFRKLVSGEGAPFAFVYVNVAGLVERFVPEDEKTVALLGKLGVSDMKAAGMGIGFDGAQVREVFALSAPGERHGILKILGSTRPLEPAALIGGIPRECANFGAMRLDWKSLFDQGIELAKAIEPSSAKKIDDTLAEIDRSLGVSLKNDLLGAMGDTLTSETYIPEAGFLPEVVFSLTLRDAARFSGTLAKLMEKVGFELHEMQKGGRTIFYVKAPLGTPGEEIPRAFDDPMMSVQSALMSLFGAWTFDGGKVFFSSHPQALEARFALMGKGSASGDPIVEEALAKLPRNATSFGVGRAGMYVGATYDIVASLVRSFEVFLRRMGIDVDSALLPRPAEVVRPFRSAFTGIAVDEEGFALVSQGGVPVMLPAAALSAGVAVYAASALRERRDADSEQMASMHTHVLLFEVAQAELQWKQQKGAYTASLDDLVQAGLLERSSVEKGSRIYMIAGSAESDHFKFTALPLRPGLPRLSIDESMEITIGSEGGEMPPPEKPPEPPEPGDDG